MKKWNDAISFGYLDKWLIVMFLATLIGPLIYLYKRTNEHMNEQLNKCNAKKNVVLFQFNGLPFYDCI